MYRGFLMEEVEIKEEIHAPKIVAADGMRPRMWMLFRLLRDYSWKFRWSYLAGGFFLWLTNYLSVSIPGEIGQAVDSLRKGGGLAPYARSIFLMGLGVVVVRSFSRVLIFNPGRHQEYLLRRDLFSKLMRLQPSFYAGTTRGDVVSRATNDLSWIRAMVGFGGLQVLNVVLALSLSCWKMFQISANLSLMALTPILLGLFLVQLGIRRVFVLGRRAQEQLAEISEHVLGSLQGIAAIQSYVAEEAFIRRFEQRNLSWLETGLRLSLIRASLLPLLALSGGISMFVVLVVGGRMTIAGSLSVGELAAFAALLMVLLPTLRSMGWMLSVFARGLAALERVFGLLDVTEERPEGSSGFRSSSKKGPDIRIRGLSFAYPDSAERVVLRNIDAEFPSGEMIGIFGATGSGKSSLLRLIARLYNPAPASLFSDGVDLLSWDLGSWRAGMAYVSQRPFLFSDTIRANIVMAEEADELRLASAVTDAALDADLGAFNEGLETVVGERGLALSGGQRQRVALARALYRRSELLILDDVLSAVDQSTERRLVDTLLGLQNKEIVPTILVASHRLSVLRRASRVLVLEGGRAVAMAPHEELLETVETYRHAWKLQSEENTGENRG